MRHVSETHTQSLLIYKLLLILLVKVKKKKVKAHFQWALY